MIALRAAVRHISRNTEESGKERKGAATDVRSGIEETGRCLNGWDVQSKHIQPENGIAESLYAGECRGGKGILIQDERTGALSTLNNQSVCAFEPGAASRLGGYCWEDKAGTLRANAGDNQQAVVYGISAYESNAMKSANPNSGVYEAETARTLDLNGGSPACNQGGMAVVCATTEMTPKTDEDGVSFSLRSRDYKDPQIVCLEGNGSRPSHRGDGYSESETMYTLNSTERHAVVVENHPADSRVKVSEDGVVQTLSSRMGTGGGNVPMVMEPMCIGNGQADQARLSEKVGALNCMHDQQAVDNGLERAAFNQGKNAKLGFSIEEEKIGTQTAKGPGAVCTAVDCRNATENEINGSLQSSACHNTNSNNVCRTSIVRRLTPLECERLQGYPDGWCDIGDWVDSKGKKHKDADSPKYKALGNSIALPFWYYLLKRISATYDEGYNPTLGSLFDGIGGFPLCWERINGTGTARWASEIEEFCIAVTKKHFKEEKDGESNGTD